VRSADIGFCNLECVLTDLPRPKSRGFVFRADPRNAEFLERAGFDLVSIANNHVLDCGIDGYREMVAALQSADLTPVSGEPVIQEANGLTLGALAYDLVETRRVDGMLEAVAELDRLADIVIVSLHWGVEYTLSPADWQVRLARELVDYGADLVLGHHPHRVQGIACYGGAVIVYSMGNCIFDQRDPLGNESVVLLIELTEYGVHQVTILPVSITGFRPAIASGASGERILSSLALHSERLGTKVITLREEDAVRARFYPFRDVIQADRNKNRDSGRRGS
jgi:poly-gamma-glutamate synthesis protein (capsule biosynthesis protein)